MSIERPQEITDFNESPSGFEAGHVFESVEDGLIMEHKDDCTGNWEVGESNVHCPKCGAEYPKNKGTEEFARLDNEAGAYLDTLSEEGQVVMEEEKETEANRPWSYYYDKFTQNYPNDNHEANIELLRKSIGKQPTHVAYQALAMLLMKLERDKEALGAINSALKLDEKSGEYVSDYEREKLRMIKGKLRRKLMFSLFNQVKDKFKKK